MWTKRFIAGLCVVFGVSIHIGCDDAVLFGEDKYAEKLNWTFDGSNIVAIDAEAENGTITVIGSSRNSIVVDVTKEVRDNDLEDAEEFAAEIEVFAERRGNTIYISMDHPKPPRGMDVSVEYYIQTPQHISVDLQTSNGKIEILGIDGAIDASTSNGMIALEGGDGRINLHTSNGRIEINGTTGSVVASTSNGAIVADLDALANEGVFSTSNSSIDVMIRSGIATVTATTANGSIDLTLPSSFSGKLDARTTNGRISSEFAVTEADNSEKSRLVGKLGAGGDATVTLRSSNGNIDLRKTDSDSERRRRY